jgi:hypothetical protein
MRVAAVDDRALVLLVAGVITLGSLVAFLVQYFRGRDRD